MIKTTKQRASERKCDVRNALQAVMIGLYMGAMLVIALTLGILWF